MWIVIGSGSKVWNSLRDNWQNSEIVEVGGRDFESFYSDVYPDLILYVANPPAKILRRHIRKIHFNYPRTKLVFLSSLVVQVSQEAQRYSYVAEKALKEKVVVDECKKLGLSYCVFRPGQ